MSHTNYVIPDQRTKSHEKAATATVPLEMTQHNTEIQ